MRNTTNILIGTMIVSLLAVSFPILKPNQATAQFGNVCPTFDEGEAFTTTAASSVWEVGPDERKRYYPNAQIFLAWNDDFEEVETIEPRCFNVTPDALSTPFGVNHVPGTLIKRFEFPAVYVVGTQNRIWRVQNADVAEAIWGTNWGTRVKDVSSVYWPNYDVQPEVIDETDEFVDGMMVRRPGTFTRYMYLAGVLYPISGNFPDNFRERVITPSNALWQQIKGAVTSEQQITAQSILNDPTQVDPEFVLVPIE